jgi:hypothetical protein
LFFEELKNISLIIFPAMLRGAQFGAVVPARKLSGLRDALIIKHPKRCER